MSVKPNRFHRGFLRLLLLALAGLFATSATVAVMAGQDRAARAIKKNDRNQDGRVSREEWRKAPGIFKRIDSNGDGYLSVDEFRAHFDGRSGSVGNALARVKPGNAVVSATQPPTISNKSDGMYFIDAHSQWDHRVDRERVLSLMDHGGVYRTLLSVHLQRPWQDVVDFARSAPERIVPAVQIKGRGYFKGPERKYFERLRNQLRNPAFAAMAEILVWHDSDSGKYQEIRADFENNLVQAAMESAHRKHWPVIIHIEFASLETSDRQQYMQALDTLLSRNRQQAFVLIHMGQLEAGPVERLLREHPNLYFMTSHASPFYQHADTGRHHGKPFINMIDGGRFKPQWQRLVLTHPDRFVFALDNVFSKFWVPKLYLAKMRMWWQVVDSLPSEVAHAFAHRNAERLWQLDPKKDGGMLRPAETLARLGAVSGHSSAQ